jgi:hypothetical protein
MCIACGTSATSPIGYFGFTCGRVQSAVTLTSTVGRPSRLSVDVPEQLMLVAPCHVLFEVTAVTLLVNDSGDVTFFAAFP